MTVADLLAAEFLAAGADVERGRDRAAAAAISYIARRLQQLERRFHRHRFTYTHRRSFSRLYVYPMVGRTNDVQSLLCILCSRATRWRTMAALRRVEVDLGAVSTRAEREFGRLLGYIAAGQATGQVDARIIGKQAQAYDRSIHAQCTADDRRLNRPLARRS